MSTQVVEIFLEMVRARRQGLPMKPRSANDKEYFAQDWFTQNLKALQLEFDQQGRNCYPDFWVGEGKDREGYEIKSLAFTGNKPARKDLDFNSTIPSGLKEGANVFLVFFLYTGSGVYDRVVHSISLAHGDLLNADHALADEHLNVSVHKFGSFADGFIRNRKMYVFPHPITLVPDGLSKNRLIVPREWAIQDKRLRKVRSIDRTIVQRTVDNYTIRLRGRGEAQVRTRRAPDAGKVLKFDVFEAV